MLLALYIVFAVVFFAVSVIVVSTLIEGYRKGMSFPWIICGFVLLLAVFLFSVVCAYQALAILNAPPPLANPETTR